jgi:hypothetical protein
MSLFTLITASTIGAPPKRKTVKEIVYINDMPAYVQSQGMWYAASKQATLPKTGKPLPRSILWSKKSFGIPKDMSDDLHPGNWRTLHYKVEGDLGYVSTDRHDWRLLQIKVMQIGPKCSHSKGSFIQRVYLECDFFAGIFDDVSPVKEPSKLKPCE